MPKIASFPFHVMAKPAGPACHLACKYCFYIEKEALFPDHTRFRMRPEVLESYVRQTISASPGSEVTFAWQGGEPTLLGVEFYRQAVELQKRYSDGRPIHNALQTNGTLLDETWARFLRAEGFLVGISIDGPAAIHDAVRVDRRGQPTHAQVVRGLDLLRKAGVEFNTLTCVHRHNQDRAEEVYRYLKGLGSRHLQFIPIVERKPGAQAKELGLSNGTPSEASAVPPSAVRAAMHPLSVQPEAYGRFLATIFDRWVRHDVGRVFVQDFDVALALWLGLPSPLCIHAETCGRALALEHDGTLFACDHFVYPEYRLGNLTEQPLAEIVNSPAAHRFGQDKRDRLPNACRACPVRFACAGGCPKHRFVAAPDGAPGLNYLCAGYRHFYQHIDAPMRTMARLVADRQPAAAIMPLLAGRN